MYKKRLQNISNHFIIKEDKTKGEQNK